MNLKVIYKPTKDLIPYVNNSRKHSEKQITQIAASIKEFGFNNPILLDGKNGLIAGHGRLEAAIKLNMDKIPTIEISHLSEAQKKAYIIADNQLTLNADWDRDALKLEFEFLNEAEFDLDLLGFDEKFQDLLNPEKIEEGKTDPDEIPKNVETRCKPGDLWKLGEHRLLCGDSTNIQHVERLMNGEKAQTFFSDPPYGDNVGGLKTKSASEIVPGKSLIKRSSFIANDKEIDWLVDVFNIVPSFMTEPSTKMVFFKWDKYVDILQMASAFGKPSALCVWDRVRRANNFFRFQPQHELCLHWGNQEDKKESMSLANVWHEPKELENKELHPTVKPISILEPAIRVTTDKKAIVLDLFLGSGSTLIACEKTGRKCYGMEIDPHYCDVIISRWEAFTGLEARRLDDGGL
jgi:DNA modification methylase